MFSNFTRFNDENMEINKKLEEKFEGYRVLSLLYFHSVLDYFLSQYFRSRLWNLLHPSNRSITSGSTPGLLIIVPGQDNTFPS